jgi:hypothetical protein
MLQKPPGRHAHARIELVDIAGNEQADAHGEKPSAVSFQRSAETSSLLAGSTGECHSKRQRVGIVN